MKIIIDIPEELYKALKKYGCIDEERVWEIELSILNGTPLPKGTED